MAEDRYANKRGMPDAPAWEAEDVTPSDSVNLDPPARYLYIGTTGDVSVVMKGGGNTVVFSNHPVGYFPQSVSRVNSTGTTASDIIACR